MSDFITVAELRIEAERLCDENDQLKDENAKLKNDADLLRAMLSQVQTEKRCYMAENVKLRELAAGIGHLLFVLDVDYCAICPRDDINHPCPVHTVKGGECLYETDMRELGIEVDG